MLSVARVLFEGVCHGTSGGFLLPPVVVGACRDSVAAPFEHNERGGGRAPRRWPRARSHGCNNHRPSFRAREDFAPPPRQCRGAKGEGVTVLLPLRPIDQGGTAVCARWLRTRIALRRAAG